jgi:hypothetical protein
MRTLGGSIFDVARMAEIDAAMERGQPASAIGA